MSRKTKIIVMLVLAVFLLVLGFKGFFVVRPDQFAIVTEFGEPVDIIHKESCDDAGKRCWNIPDPGLHFKIPFIQDVRYIDARVRGWNDTGLDTKTVTNREIDFTAFARWRVSDPLQYYIAHNKGTGEATERAAHGSMDSVVTTRIQSAIRQKRLQSIVRLSDRPFAAEQGLNLNKLVVDFEECHPERNENVREALDAAKVRSKKRIAVEVELKLVDAKAGPGLSKGEQQKAQFIIDIKENANAKLNSGFGIKIYDLHFKYLNYSTKIHASMIRDIAKDRERDIETYRKIQKFCSGAIHKNKLEAVGVKLAESDRLVRKIRGNATATAIGLKARAFNEGPGFYRFIRTLELYEKSLARGTKLIISSNSPLLALMKDASVMELVEKVQLRALTDEELGEPAGVGSSPKGSEDVKKDTDKVPDTDGKEDKAAESPKENSKDAKIGKDAETATPEASEAETNGADKRKAADQK